jgi:phosphate transport system permease protein
MQSQITLQKRDVIAAALSRQAGSRTRSELHKRPRLLERFMGSIMLLCGVVSIFTTVGIVAVLGKESLLFFTPPAWIDTFKTVEIEVAAETTEIAVSSAAAFVVGEEIQVVHEQMLVTAVDVGSSKIIVERGYNDTDAVAHNAGAEIFRAEEISIIEFFSSTKWQPQLGQFGIWPLLNATLMTSAIAMLVAIPLGLSAAIYLSEYASSRVRALLKPALELLAGVPTVVYGYFALTLMTPLLRSLFGVGTVEIYNTASAGIVVGIMIIPTIASISEDALRAVPGALREASYGLGATRLETVAKVVVPAALSGVVASFILGVSRAVGETMIVSLAAGAGPNFTFNAFTGAETMTGHIVRISGGDISYNSIDYNSLFAIGLLLFVMTLVLNAASRVVTSRFREVYQ